MRIEKTYYVIMKQGNITIGDETVYMSSSDDANKGFTNDIRKADRFNGRKTALLAKQVYDFNKNNGYESDMQIVPLKLTYEW